jgi:L-lactate utilization protein LutB
MTYDQLATSETLNKVITNLAERGMTAEVVGTRAEALEKIKGMIPAGASVMNGSSRTLDEIGFIEYLKMGQHGWKNLHADILAETDKAKQAVLRKQSVLSDYYLGSVHALAETGEILIASNTGSQLPHLVFTSQNIILVVGAQKIVPDTAALMSRLQEYVFPLEDKRMKEVGMGGSAISKILLIEREQAFMGRKFHIILVNEKLGF